MVSRFSTGLLFLAALATAGPLGCSAPPSPTANHTLALLDTSAAWSSPNASDSFEVAWGDVDGNGYPDMVAAGFMEANCLFLNDGTTLTEEDCFADGSRTSSVDFGDWDGDGDLDLAVGNGQAANEVWENDAGVFSLVWTADDTSDNTMSVRWGDWDADGTLELAVGNMGGANYVYVNTGGDLEVAWTSNETEQTRSVAWGDLDGDNDDDLAVGNSNSAANHVYINTGGDLDLTPVWTSDEVSSTYSVDWGDVDGNGFLDLAEGNYNGEVNRLYLNTAGTLDTAGTELSTDQIDTKAVHFGDWDGDGDPDLAMGHGSSDTPVANEVYDNDNGTLTPSWTADTADHTTHVLWVDRDDDGDLDLAVANFGDLDLVYDNTPGQPGDDDDDDDDSAGDDDDATPGDDDDATPGDDDDDDATPGDDDDDDATPGDDDDATPGDDDDDDSAGAADERLFLCECSVGGPAAIPGALAALALLGSLLAIRRTRPGRGASLILVVAALTVAAPAGAKDSTGEELDPEAEDAFFEGNGLLAEGKAAEALAAYDRALELAPQLYRVHLYRGRALVQLGDLDAAQQAADAFEGSLSTSSERGELEALDAEIAAARGATTPPPPPPPPPPPTADHPRLQLGVTAAYAHSRGTLDNDWAVVQARVGVRLVSGLHLRAQAGLGMQPSDGALYGIVPIEVGATWRFFGPVVPFIDAHLLIVVFDDAKGADGTDLSTEVSLAGVGGGLGGGLEIPLGKSPLSLAPEVHVGWAGVLMVQAGVSLRMGLGS